MIDWKKRTYCGNVTAEHVSQTVHICGWVDAIRDHGQLLFVHLRDINGFVQLVFDPNKDKDAYLSAQSLRNEFVISIQGSVQKRTPENINPQMPTGEIEVFVDQLTILNTAKTPPFIISEKEMVADEAAETRHVDEDIRLQYRFLDLRRASMQSHLIKRSQIVTSARHILTQKGFLDIETPVLTKSTPEGARDYLVPSRIHPEHFYALPQSPQLFKQLLMVSGFDRYFQIVKCFRDEDLRPNRQPEFTQMDLEASFIDESFIYELIESLLISVFDTQGIKLPTPFPRITYDDAMSLYGSDSPELRIPMTLVDVTDTLKNSQYNIFKTIVSKGGIIKGLLLPGQAEHLSKNMLQNELAMKVIPKFGGKGMSWMKIENGEFVSNIVQFFSKEELSQLQDQLQAKDGDIMVFVADTNHRLVNSVLGQFRLYIAKRQNLYSDQKFAPCWVTDFPLFEHKDGRFQSVHHPFTQPQGDVPDSNDDIDAILALKSRAYDIVINGEEIGGGSMRIHQPDLQTRIFEILDLSPDEIDTKFGFFVNAFQYGAPPHGGIALGIDRLISMILGTDSIRDVIAFPKNRVAVCPLTKAPSPVHPKQLDDLHIQTKPVLKPV